MGFPMASSLTWERRAKQRWKGKGRAVNVDWDGRDEGTGGEDGVVLSLSLVGNGVYDA